MELQEIRVDQKTAWARYKAYRDCVETKDNKVFAKIRRTYYALSRGTPIVNVEECVRRAGVGDDGLPRLAIVRADAEWCWLHLSFSQLVMTRHDHAWDGRLKHDLAMPRGFVPQRDDHQNRFRAQAPIIPPEALALPSVRGDLSNYHILFEAEWRKEPPRDPALLRHLGGPLYALLAVWDLTEVEREVLREYL